MSEFSTVYLTRRKKNASTVVSKAIKLVDIALKILQWQLQNGNTLLGRTSNSILQWTGSCADLVEFAYAALETKRFNGGDIDENVLVQQLCELFSFEVKDCYDTFRAIRRRVDSRTLFLDEMKAKLNERMDNMDNGVFKKKRVRKK